MRIKTTQIVLGLSALLNLILGCLLYLTYNSGCTSNDKNLDKRDDIETLQSKAEIFVHDAVCDNLFYPNTYDPVRTTIDSVFYGPLTDKDCVQAAVELIDLRSQYSSAQNRYNDAVDMIKFHGITDLGTLHWGKDRDKAKSEMKSIQEKIKRRQCVIKNRDTSMDGNFIGWQVIHKYRAANSDGVVSFGNVLYILNQELTECYFSYSLDNDNNTNLKSIIEVIEAELGIHNDK